VGVPEQVLSSPRVSLAGDLFRECMPKIVGMVYSLYSGPGGNSP
jgi:hypothetical protein